MVTKKRIDLCRIYYEIKDALDWLVLPEWIEYLDTEDIKIFEIGRLSDSETIKWTESIYA